MFAGAAGERTELVQDLPVLASAGVLIAPRESPRQVVPTGLLHLAYRAPRARWTAIGT